MNRKRQRDFVCYNLRLFPGGLGWNHRRGLCLEPLLRVLASIVFTITPTGCRIWLP